MAATSMSKAGDSSAPREKVERAAWMAWRAVRRWVQVAQWQSVLELWGEMLEEDILGSSVSRCKSCCVVLMICVVSVVFVIEESM